MKNKKQNKAFLFIIIIIMVICTTVPILMMIEKNSFDLFNNNTIVLKIATLIATMLFMSYTLISLKRIRAPKYLFFSYASEDQKIVGQIKEALEEYLLRSTKYRYVFLDRQSVYLGENIKESTKNNIDKSDVVIVFVSKKYTVSSNCLSEFECFLSSKKIIFPIVLDSYEDLCRLPKNMSGIKALYLIQDRDNGDDSSKELDYEYLNKTVKELGQNIKRLNTNKE